MMDHVKEDLRNDPETEGNSIEAQISDLTDEIREHLEGG